MKLLAVIVSVIGLSLCVTSTVNAAHKKVYTGDFITATKIVGKYYGSRVRNWLVNCSSSEGGHGKFVWHNHTAPRKGNTNWPGGWMQFMESTFDNNVSWTFKDAQHKGLTAHPKARSYYEPLGQAIVAGAMYYYHGSGPWTGAYC